MFYINEGKILKKLSGKYPMNWRFKTVAFKVFDKIMITGF